MYIASTIGIIVFSSDGASIKIPPQGERNSPQRSNTQEHYAGRKR